MTGLFGTQSVSINARGDLIGTDGRGMGFIFSKGQQVDLGFSVDPFDLNDRGKGQSRWARRHLAAPAHVQRACGGNGVDQLPSTVNSTRAKRTNCSWDFGCQAQTGTIIQASLAPARYALHPAS
ncbi:hypothetical protein [Azohydromonas aeria]|uniref:hypothetical protein n=1 Tax=Azohydromonas aeria TaxID=2590212 RepID=UPI0012F7E368|nr:hypothetical protein [Azohydromonas aeria]